jgi:hypothetical protein
MPVNQKSIYHSYAMLFDKVINDEMDLKTAEILTKHLDGMNRTFANELKRAETLNNLGIKKTEGEIRMIESKPFDDKPESC